MVIFNEIPSIKIFCCPHAHFSFKKQSIKCKCQFALFGMCFILLRRGSYVDEIINFLMDHFVKGYHLILQTDAKKCAQHLSLFVKCLCSLHIQAIEEWIQAMIY